MIFREKYNINNEIVIGHVGRLHYQKNHEFMLRIAKGLFERNIDFKMIFVGSGDLENSLVSKIENYNLNNKIIMVGKTDTPENYYNMFDIFILPSIFEGLGISLVEAQSNGLPCIISENVPKEAILGSDTIVIPLADVSQWIQALTIIKPIRTIFLLNAFNIKYAINEISKYYLSFYLES
jgi:glycosyltransferase involved in cell wall biosynthesis